MTIFESSALKVPYDLRPRKQVERRMMAHVFQLLSEVGFLVSTYRYTGFGAFFFVDFILFRQLIGINDMVSIENDIRYKKRVLFNRPFKDIDVRFQSASDYLSEMSRDRRHILWLDYDGPIDREYLADLETAASILTSGSILITTLDVDFDKANDINIRESVPSIRAKAWFNRFREESGDLFNPSWKISNFTATEMPKIAVQILQSAILSGINMRDDISFEPLFNFIYADGHEMLTIGGIICSKQDNIKIKQIEWEALSFVRRNLSLPPYRIDVPVLTRRERLYMDSHMPCADEWEPKKFEIESKSIKDYREVYRYCPLYAEFFL